MEEPRWRAIRTQTEYIVVIAVLTAFATLPANAGTPAAAVEPDAGTAVPPPASADTTVPPPASADTSVPPPASADTTVPQPASADYLNVGGSKLYYESFGQGPALVLVHDELLHRETWDGQIAAFAEEHRVIRYDRRGFGRSELATGAYSDREDLTRLLDHLEVDRAVVVGSSSGGGLAADFALAHPRRVEALVLVAAMVDGLGFSSHLTRRNSGNFGPDAETSIGLWAEDPHVVAPGSSAARERLRQLMLANPQNLDRSGYYYRRQYDYEQGPAAEPAAARLAEIAVPVLIVTGGEDFPDVHVHAGALEAGIAGARRVLVPGAGHLVQMDRTHELNRIVLEFLSLISVDRSGGAGDETQATSFERGFAKVRGTYLYYEAMGEGHPLVLIHGGLLDHRMWDDQLEALSGKFRVIRYDVQGHGLSKSVSWLHSDHQDLSGLLEHLGIEKAHVMGLSMGGRIAIDFALEYPEKVSALIPVSSGLSGYRFAGEDLAENRKAFGAARSRGDLAGAVEAFQRSWTDGPGRAPGEVDPTVRERVRSMAVECLQPGKHQGEGLWPDPPASERLAEISVPTLAVVGSLDMSDIHAISDLVAGQVEGARKAVIPGVAHMANMERPQELNRIVLELLSRQQ